MIELLNDTIRYRVLSPSKFTQFRSKELGQKGKMSIIIGYDGKGWKIQSYRFKLSDYSSVTDVLHDANTIKGITASDKDKIASLTRKYFRSVN